MYSKVYDYKDARFEVRKIQNPVIIGDAWISANGSLSTKWIIVKPFANQEVGQDLYIDTIKEIKDKLEPLGWIEVKEDEVWGKPVIS